MTVLFINFNIYLSYLYFQPETAKREPILQGFRQYREGQKVDVDDALGGFEAGLELGKLEGALKILGLIEWGVRPDQPSKIWAFWTVFFARSLHSIPDGNPLKLRYVAQAHSGARFSPIAGAGSGRRFGQGICKAAPAIPVHIAGAGAGIRRRSTLQPYV